MMKLSENEIKAKSEALKGISAKASQGMFDKLKGLKKSSGLQKAKEMIAPMEDVEEVEEAHEEAPETHDESDMSIEEIDEKIAELEQLKAKKLE